MTDRIQPFHRVAQPVADDDRRDGVISLLRLHFLAAGVVILAAGVGLLALIYPELNRMSLTTDLRVQGGSDLYSRRVQLTLLVALSLGLVSLIPLRAVNRLRSSGGSLWLPRAAALVLLAGIPAGIMMWQYVTGIPPAAADRTTAQQVIGDVGWVAQVLAVLLVLQALLALWYQVWLSSHATRLATRSDGDTLRAPLRWLRGWAVGLWVVLICALALSLGVVTDWLYELPVPTPVPGELLYATTFDDFNDEWDTFPGRDSVLIVPRMETALGPEVPNAALSGPVMVITYGAGVAEEVIWSTLDRKLADFDLRVTAQQLVGPVDQNQYGVIFRYQDSANFYIFQISSDGYYTLKKVTGGVQEQVSVWGFSDAIQQGEAANDVRVVGRGAAFQFFVNDIPMALCTKGENRTSMWSAPGECFTDELRWVYEDETFGQGRIALVAGTIDGSEIAAAFDDVVIVGPEPRAENGELDQE